MARAEVHKLMERMAIPTIAAPMFLVSNPTPSCGMADPPGSLVGACGLPSRPAMLEAVDVLLGMLDRRVLVVPGEADFEGGERAAIDNYRKLVRAADPGVPKSASGLEGLDVVTVVKMCHGPFPAG